MIVEVAEPTPPGDKPTKCVGKSYLTHLLRNSPLETFPGVSSGLQQDGTFHDQNQGTLAPRSRDTSDSASEETSLLPKSHPNDGRHASYDATSQPNGDVESRHEPGLLSRVDVKRVIYWPTEKGLNAVKSILHRRAWSKRDIWQHGVAEPAGYIPAVLLGLLLNVLDGLSYGRWPRDICLQNGLALINLCTGMILFPLGQSIFSDLGPDGLSIFYVSCIISQLVYSCGGSIFKGGIGSEMVRSPNPSPVVSSARPPFTFYLFY